MKKIFTCLCALLAVQDFEVVDGNITLTEEQTDKIEGHVAQLEKDLNDANAAKKAAEDAQADLQAKLGKALKDVQERDQQIANLKKAPGAEDNGSAGEKNHDGEDVMSTVELFNSVNI